MRKDVKAGMALALIVVVVAGWYYSRDPSSQSAITLGPEPAPRGEPATGVMSDWLKAGTVEGMNPPPTQPLE